MTTPTPPAPAGVDPDRWARASWHARQQLLAQLAAAARPADAAPRYVDPDSRHVAVCVNGHELTSPDSWYQPPSRPDRRDCRLCRRERARIRQRRRRAAARAARLDPTPSTTDRTEHAA